MKLFDHRGDGSWLGDLADFLSFFSLGARGKFILGVLGLGVLGVLLFYLGHLSGVSAPAASSPALSESASPSPSPSASASPSPSAPLSTSLPDALPVTWTTSSKSGCSTFLTTTDAVSSLLVENRFTELLKAADFTVNVKRGTDTMTLTATGEQGSLTGVEADFTTGELTLCLR